MNSGLVWVLGDTSPAFHWISRIDTEKSAGYKLWAYTTSNCTVFCERNCIKETRKNRGGLISRGRGGGSYKQREMSNRHFSVFKPMTFNLWYQSCLLLFDCFSFSSRGLKIIIWRKNNVSFLCTFSGIPLFNTVLSDRWACATFLVLTSGYTIIVRRAARDSFV